MKCIGRVRGSVGGIIRRTNEETRIKVDPPIEERYLSLPVAQNDMQIIGRR